LTSRLSTATPKLSQLLAIPEANTVTVVFGGESRACRFLGASPILGVGGNRLGGCRGSLHKTKRTKAIKKKPLAMASHPLIVVIAAVFDTKPYDRVALPEASASHGSLKPKANSKAWLIGEGMPIRSSTMPMKRLYSADEQEALHGQELAHKMTGGRKNS
jgi:hypothetical protein